MNWLECMYDKRVFLKVFTYGDVYNFEAEAVYQYKIM